MALRRVRECRLGEITTREESVNHEGPLLDVANDFRIIACEACQFAHAVPVPTDEDLAKFYKGDYYGRTKPLYIHDAIRDAGWWQLVYNERYAMIENWVTSGTRSVLDVGSGPGYFLAEGRRRGWEGVGIEPSDVARSYSQSSLGLTVYDTVFDDEFEKTWSRFDLVNFGEVLEHVPDPAAYLRRAFRILNHGGVVCVVVPNDFNAFQHALVKTEKQNPYWVCPPQHINYFSVTTLHALMRRCGFTVADVTCTFPMELFLVAGQNYVKDTEIGNEVHAWRKRFELSMETLGLGDLKREAYRALARRGLGRDIVMFGKKLKAES